MGEYGEGHTVESVNLAQRYRVRIREVGSSLFFSNQFQVEQPLNK